MQFGAVWERHMQNFTGQFFRVSIGALALVIASVSTASADASCKGQFKLRSKNSDTPTTITFVNKSKTMRSIIWLDFKGGTKDYAQLEAGKSVTLNTFMTHPWMVTTGPGDCLQIVLPRPGGSTIKLTDTGGSASGGGQGGGEEGDQQTSCPPGTVPVPETDNCVKPEKKQASCGWYAVYECGSSKKLGGPGFTVKSEDLPGVGAEPYCNVGGPFDTQKDAKSQIKRFGGDVRQACK